MIHMKNRTEASNENKLAGSGGIWTFNFFNGVPWHTEYFILIIFKFLNLKGRVIDLCFASLISQMPATIRARPSQSQELQSPPRSLLWGSRETNT